MESDLNSLNERFAIPGRVTFLKGLGGLVTVRVENRHAVAMMTLAGGHVTTYAPRRDERNIFWISPNSAHTIGRAMRGGVPVCWPWFGAPPEGGFQGALQGGELPSHGVARTQLWEMAGTRRVDDDSTEVRMVLRDNERTRAVWPYAFELELIVTVGPRLKIEWAARNPGAEPFTYTGALHPYFAVADAQDVRVHGLDGVGYLDKNNGFRHAVQHGPVTFTGEVDYVFTGTTSALAIEDPGMGRTIRIAKSGSRTSVVWNPYHGDARLPDVGAGQHRNFVCVEAANAVDDVVTVTPGEEERLGMEIWSE